MSFNYSYSQFVSDCKALVNDSKGIFSICTNELLNVVYLKSMMQIIDNKYTVDLNIIFSEVYQMPVLYFTIYSNDDSSIINFDKYITENKVDSSIIKMCEISKENHPLNGSICEFMHLCKLNQMLSQMNDIKNVLTFWLSIILQMFNVDLYKLVKNNKSNILFNN